MNFAQEFWARARGQLKDDLNDPEAIAEEYDVPLKDVKEVIKFINENPRKRVENFLFLFEQLTR